MRIQILVLSATFLTLPALAQTSGAKTTQAAIVKADANVPADVHQFYRDYNTALLSHDIKRIMPFFSEHYLHEGRNKAAQKTWMLEWLNDLTRLETHLVRFTQVDTRRAYIEGRWEDNFTGGTFLPGTQLVKENGQWKLFGNQKRYDR